MIGNVFSYHVGVAHVTGGNFSAPCDLSFESMSLCAASWSPLFGGAQGGKSLNKEASWSPLFGGAQRGWKFKSRSFMETIVWWSAGGGKV